MYDEIRRDLESGFKEFPQKKNLQWGTALKALLEERKTQGLDGSVPWLSKETGINPKHLFNIIALRVKDPPSEKLLKISDALGISYAEFSQRALAEYPGACFVTGFNQRGYIEYSQHGFSIQCCTPPGTGTRDFFAGIMIIKPFKELKKWKFDKGSMIFILVESGTLELTFGNKVKRIHSNESVYFDGGVPHKLRNIDSIEARLILITRPPLH